jgi:hypothetical protein
MPEAVSGAPDLSCFHLFSKTEIQQSESLGPDTFLPRARGNPLLAVQDRGLATLPERRCGPAHFARIAERQMLPVRMLNPVHDLLIASGRQCVQQSLRRQRVECDAGVTRGNPAVANAGLQCRTVRCCKAPLLRDELALGHDRANLVCVRCVLSQPCAEMCDARRGQVGVGEKGQNSPLAGQWRGVPPPICRRRDRRQASTLSSRVRPTMHPAAYQSVGRAALGAEPASERCCASAGVDGEGGRQIHDAAVCRQPYLPASVGVPDQAWSRRCEQSGAASDRDRTQPAVKASSIEVPAMPVGIAHEVGHLRGSGAPKPRDCRSTACGPPPETHRAAPYRPAAGVRRVAAPRQSAAKHPLDARPALHACSAPN